MNITLTELRRTPGPALDQVRAGKEVVVTEAGVPLCRIVPIDKPTRYAALFDQGVLQLPSRSDDPAEIRRQSLEKWNANA